MKRTVVLYRYFNAEFENTLGACCLPLGPFQLGMDITHICYKNGKFFHPTEYILIIHVIFIWLHKFISLNIFSIGFSCVTSIEVCFSSSNEIFKVKRMWRGFKSLIWKILNVSFKYHINIDYCDIHVNSTNWSNVWRTIS